MTRTAFSLAIILAVILAGSFIVSANPRASPPPPEPTKYAHYLSVFFAVDFLLNLFWFSLLMLVALTWTGLKGIWSLPGRFKFHASVITSVILITVMGIGIDLTFIYKNAGGWAYALRENGDWTTAGLLVGLSVFLVTVSIERMKTRQALVPTIGMMAMNLVWWSFQDAPIVADNWFLPFILGSMVPIIFFGLDRWHKGAYPAWKGPPEADKPVVIVEESPSQ